MSKQDMSATEMTAEELAEQEAQLLKAAKLSDLMASILLARVDDVTHTAKAATIKALQSRGLLDRNEYPTTLGCQVADALIWQRHKAQEADALMYKVESDAYERHAQVLADEYYANATSEDIERADGEGPIYVASRTAMLDMIAQAYNGDPTFAREIYEIMGDGDFIVADAVYTWSAKLEARARERWDALQDLWDQDRADRLAESKPATVIMYATGLMDGQPATDLQIELRTGHRREDLAAEIEIERQGMQRRDALASYQAGCAAIYARIDHSADSGPTPAPSKATGAFLGNSPGHL